MVYMKFRKCLAVLIGLALTATGLWAGAASEEEPAAAAEKEMVRDPATGKIVTAPEYGGTITYGRSGKTGAHSDAWFIGGWATHYISLVNEKLGIGNWAIDRNEFDWRSLFMPEFAVTGVRRAVGVCMMGRARGSHLTSGIWQGTLCPKKEVKMILKEP